MPVASEPEPTTRLILNNPRNAVLICNTISEIILIDSKLSFILPAYSWCFIVLRIPNTNTITALLSKILDVQIVTTNF